MAGLTADWAWNVWFERLRDYPARKLGPSRGKRLVPITYETPNGHKLGWWLESQREAYHAGTLSPEVVSRLESVGHVWDVQAALFDEGATYLEALPPDDDGRRAPLGAVLPTRNKDGVDLSVWLEEVRGAYRRDELDAGSITRLDAARIVWDPHQEAWDHGFAHFIAYPEEESGRHVSHKSHTSLTQV